MPIQPKPYRRRFPLSRKGRLAPPVIREYTAVFEIDHHCRKYPAAFMRYLGLNGDLITPTTAPLSPLMDGLRTLWQESQRKILTLVDHTTGVTTIHLTRCTEIGTKLSTYVARNHPLA